MAVGVLITILVLSYTKYANLVGTYLIKWRKYISYTLYALSLLSFLILTNDFISIKKTGEFALELLWIILYLPILAKVFNASIAQKLMMYRKELGILMGTMALVHALQYFLEPYSYQFWQLEFWFQNGQITYLGWGMLALIIAIVLTATSNTWSIKKMGKYWKYLHRTVYLLLIFTLIHVAAVKIAYSSKAENIYLVYLEELFPLFIYFVFKILEYKNVRLDLLIKKLIKN